jgi:hypothetical protein
LRIAVFLKKNEDFMISKLKVTACIGFGLLFIACNVGEVQTEQENPYSVHEPSQTRNQGSEPGIEETDPTTNQANQLDAESNLDGSTNQLESESSADAEAADPIELPPEVDGPALVDYQGNQENLIELDNTTQIIQFGDPNELGIGWTLGGTELEVGKFANGDYWIIGPVELVSTLPEATNGRHGFMLNPDTDNEQRYDERINYCIWVSGNQVCGVDYFPPINLPATIEPGTSIVKVHSTSDSCDYNRPCLETSGVLTVLAVAPPNDAFRPPYFGSDKPLFEYSEINWNLIPSLSAAGFTESEAAVEAAAAIGEELILMPSLEQVKTRFERLQGPDHFTTGGGPAGRTAHPRINMVNTFTEGDYSEYGAEMARDMNIAMLRLMLDDPLEHKRDALIAVIQAGIDWNYTAKAGMNWYSMAGQHLGRMAAPAFAATVLEAPSMTSFIQEHAASHFQEARQTHVGEHSGISMWGDPCSPSNYWQKIKTGSGSKTCRDPYGYIDGGWRPNVFGDNYQTCCSSKAYVGMALAMELSPEFSSTFNSPSLHAYGLRWATSGVHAQPDPCAPNSQGGGIDPTDNLKCVLDPDLTPGSTFENFSCQSGKACGRFPDAHGAFVNSGYYGHPFIDGMRDAFY